MRRLALLAPLAIGLLISSTSAQDKDVKDGFKDFAKDKVESKKTTITSPKIKPATAFRVKSISTSSTAAPSA